MVKYLISKGADVNTGRFAASLRFTWHEADADTVKLLLHAGARKDYCTNDELAPYDIAKQRGNSLSAESSEIRSLPLIRSTNLSLGPSIPMGRF